MQKFIFKKMDFFNSSMDKRITNAIKRLENDLEMYKNEINTLQNEINLLEKELEIEKLNNLEKPIDDEKFYLIKYKRNQIKATEKAITSVLIDLEKFRGEE